MSSLWLSVYLPISNRGIAGAEAVFLIFPKQQLRPRRVRFAITSYRLADPSTNDYSLPFPGMWVVTPGFLHRGFSFLLYPKKQDFSEGSHLLISPAPTWGQPMVPKCSPEGPQFGCEVSSLVPFLFPPPLFRGLARILPSGGGTLEPDHG